MQNENTGPAWNSPADNWGASGISDTIIDRVGFPAYSIAEALEAFGAFTLDGLKIVQKVWNPVEFVGKMDFGLRMRLGEAMVELLAERRLPRERASEEHADTLINLWQSPMYHIDFRPIPVSLKELQDRRNEELYS